MTMIGKNNKNKFIREKKTNKLPSCFLQFGGSVTVTRSPAINEGRCSDRSGIFKTK